MTLIFGRLRKARHNHVLNGMGVAAKLMSSSMHLGLSLTPLHIALQLRIFIQLEI
jgi:hypothetical protein